MEAARNGMCTGGATGKTGKKLIANALKFPLPGKIVGEGTEGLRHRPFPSGTPSRNTAR